ncbi:MAG: hypothetical protein ACTSUE_06915 [Promethearchaeota archaeon]
MSQSNFIPLSSQLGITGTSYRLQLGKIGDKWGARILKGKDVVASTALSELNGNMVVGFVLRETAIPNLNPYSIMKTVQFLTREAQGNEERMKTQGIPAPAAQPATATAPAAQPASQPAATAPVDTEMMSNEDKRASYRVVARPQPDAASVPATPAPASVALNKPKTVSSTGRKLRAIPGSGAAPVESKPEPVQESKQAPSGALDLGAIKEQLDRIEEKLDRLLSK